MFGRREWNGMKMNEKINFRIFLYSLAWELLGVGVNLISGRGPKARRSYLKKWARPINVDTC